MTLSMSYGDIHRAEGGMGLTYYSYDRGPYRARSTGTLFPTIHAGYRMQQKNGGLLLRAGVMIHTTSRKPFNPYMCVGWAF